MFNKPPTIYHSLLARPSPEITKRLTKDQFCKTTSSNICFRISTPKHVFEQTPRKLCKPFELSTIRRVDPVYEPVPPADCDAPRVLHEYTQNDYKSVNEYHDNDIEMALRRLQESHDMLNSQNKEMMEKTPTTPEKQKPISVLEQETPRLKSTLFNQFPSMNRKGLQIN
ncbi:hypothetical protein L596_012383 [Steinernema carpocapsae]|uniref:Uncharacterized protein n=1 Tax=Steinernema carpocapsae TaxID=34508 RepID=A0A4U5NXQ3_STECR|nr:hypothetical protein L596_012383 [Steinernema carpocapsae]